MIWQDELAVLARGGVSTETLSKLFANHNAFRFLEGGPSSNPELIELFVPGWGERYCNNENLVKNNAIFEPPSMRACSSTPPKQNQDFVKEHNRTPLKSDLLRETSKAGMNLHNEGKLSKMLSKYVCAINQFLFKFCTICFTVS